MKKLFSNKIIHSIIYSVKNGLNMFTNSKTVKIASISVITFCMGLSLTCVVISAKTKLAKPNGVGGFETSAVPEFDSNYNIVLKTSGAKGSSASATDSAENEAVFSDASEKTVTGEVSESSSAVASSGLYDSSLITYQTYRVKSGDMIGFIADAFDVTQDTIISVNNIKNTRTIQPGQYLKIPSMPGIVYTVKTDGETPETIAEKYNVDAAKCALVNFVSVDSPLASGSSLFVPDAALDAFTLAEINGDLFKKPLHARYWLSSNYGWRDSPFSTGKRSFHSGIDMAVGQGTPIYPAMSGIVETAGFNATYGNYVIIRHHSGYKTLYGHMVKPAPVKAGNYVYAGTTVIGYVGNTGMSTGPHLHFTVYKNGKTVNPLTLLN